MKYHETDTIPQNICDYATILELRRDSMYDALSDLARVADPEIVLPRDIVYKFLTFFDFSDIDARVIDKKNLAYHLAVELVAEEVL